MKYEIKTEEEERKKYENREKSNPKFYIADDVIVRRKESRKENQTMNNRKTLSSISYFISHISYLKRKSLRFTLIELLVRTTC